MYNLNFGRWRGHAQLSSCTTNSSPAVKFLNVFVLYNVLDITK